MKVFICTNVLIFFPRLTEFIDKGKRILMDQRSIHSYTIVY